MKALLCGACGDIQALQTDWRSCRCGNTKARWTDPTLGLAEFDGLDRSKCYLLGLNNQLLVPAMLGDLGVWEEFRAAHDRATNAPHHVFDKSRAGCWAVVVKVGRTSDVKWVEDAAPPSPDGPSDDPEHPAAPLHGRQWDDA